MKEQCAVLSTEEQKKGVREERSGAGKWEPGNSHDSQWEDCLETRGGDRWTQRVHSLLVLEVFAFCCSLTFHLNMSTHLLWNQHPGLEWSIRI